MIIIFVQQAQAANLLLMKYGSCHNDQYAAGGVILTYCSKTFLLVLRVYYSVSTHLNKIHFSYS